MLFDSPRLRLQLSVYSVRELVSFDNNYQLNTILIVGTNFRLLAGIEHISTVGGLGGHYRLWKKAPRGWILIDDDKPPISRTSIVEELKNFHIYAYEKQ